MLSGPVELLLGDIWMASSICLAVRVNGEACRDFVCLSMMRFPFLVLCLTVLTNWLLKALAFCCGVVAGLLLNEIIVFGCSWVVLFLRLLIVFQSVYEFFLWSPMWSSFSFHCLVLCVEIAAVILSLRVLMSGFVGVLALSIFLSFIRIWMFSGSGFVISLIRPFGMYRLSARRMR